MMWSLKDKTALITGATGKLASAVCYRLAECGVHCALHYHSNQSLAESMSKEFRTKGLTANCYQSDLTQKSQPEELVRRVLADFGKVEILINSASLFFRREFKDTGDMEWENLMNLHATVPFKLARALHSNFQNHESAIINMADIWGLRPTKVFFAYSVSKSALIALTKALADELAPKTTVNAVAPGIIHFDPETSDSARKTILNRIPIGRVGRVDEVAECVCRILQNRYITGQVVVIDGGRSLMLE
jgi:pteridine reductase